MHLAHARLLNSQDASGTSRVINQQCVSLAASITWRMCYQARALPKRRAVLSQHLLIHASVGMVTGLARARVGGSNAKSARCSLDRSLAGLRYSVTSLKLGERQYSFSGSHFGEPVLRCGLPFRPAPCQYSGTTRGLFSSHRARSFWTPEYGRRATPRAQTPVLG